MTDTTTTEPTAREAVMGDNSAAMDVKAMVKEDPKIVFRDAEILPKLLAAIDKEIEDAAPTLDVSTKAGRDAIRTRAADIGRLKAGLDKTGLALTEDFRKQTALVNEVRNEIKRELGPRDDKAREKLTEWEEAEKKKAEHIRDTRALIEKFTRIPAAAVQSDVDYARKALGKIALTEETFGEVLPIVTKELQAALDALAAHETKLKQDEADKAELAKLRAENDARIAREQEAERIANATKAQEERDAEIRERAAEAAAQKERDAADARQREADAAKQRELDAAAERTRQAEAEAERLRDAERERLRLEAEADAEEKARFEDAEHRKQVIELAAADMANVSGIALSKARQIAQAIAAGSVSGVEMVF